MVSFRQPGQPYVLPIPPPRCLSSTQATSTSTPRRRNLNVNADADASTANVHAAGQIERGDANRLSSPRPGDHPGGGSRSREGGSLQERIKSAMLLRTKCSWTIHVQAPTSAFAGRDGCLGDFGLHEGRCAGRLSVRRFLWALASKVNNLTAAANDIVIGNVPCLGLSAVAGDDSLCVVQEGLGLRAGFNPSGRCAMALLERIVKADGTVLEAHGPPYTQEEEDAFYDRYAKGMMSGQATVVHPPKVAKPTKPVTTPEPD
jgi:hypothetical protein